MRYVITGATSFLGRALCRSLTEAGHEVTAIVRRPSEDLMTYGCAQVIAEIQEYGGLYRDIPEADVFIHLAWEGTGHDGRNAEEVHRANVINSIAAMFGADKMGCRLFVESGSQAEYGTVTDVITEDTACQPFSAYGKAKLKMKEEGFSLAEELGMKYMHLRIFSLYGEEDHPWTLVMSAIDKMLSGEDVPLSPCTQMWNFLYAEDAACLITRLCQHAMADDNYRHEVYHIASQVSRPLREYVEDMHRLTGSKSQLLFGAITPQNLVSLRPSMQKTLEAAGDLQEVPFEEVIRRIIRKKR